MSHIILSELTEFPSPASGQASLTRRRSGQEAVRTWDSERLEEALTTLNKCFAVAMEHAFHNPLTTVRIGWVQLASATSGFSGHKKLAYCSSAKGLQ